MSTKLSIEQANELLSKINVDIVVVAEGEEADKEPNIEALSKGVFADVEEKMKHDLRLEVKGEASQEQWGRALGSLRTSFAREFGINKKEVETLDLNDMVKYVAEHVKKNGSENSAELLTKIQDAAREKEDALAAVNAEWEAKLNASDSKFNDYLMKERLHTLINEIPKRDGVDPLMLADIALERLKGNYVAKYNSDKKEIELFDKNNPEKYVFDGKNPVTDKYYAKQIVEKMGAYAQDMRSTKPSDVQNGNTAIKPGIQKQEGDYLSVEQMMAGRM